METKDLMIGDIVNVDGYIFPLYVMAIHNFDDVEVADNIDSDCWNMVSILDIEPFRLTDEVLKMMGFEMQDTGYMIGFFGQFVIGRTPTGDFYVDGRGGDHFDKLFHLNIEYVHQLQHLLNFLGIEKNIKI